MASAARSASWTRFARIRKGLVITHRVLGTQVYDARLVAAMLAHGIDRILTSNVADFSRYGVTAVQGAKSSGWSTIGNPCGVRSAARSQASR